MDKFRWIIFAAIIVLVLGGLIVYSRMNSTSVDVSNVDATAIIGPSEQNGNIGDHVYNDTESSVILVEYGDFQCPGCGSAHPYVKTLLEEYGDRISFVFRNFPLTSIHPNARAAAAAAEAAGLQGKYWEMHDVIFENQSEWQNANTSDRLTTFISYAEDLDLDVAQFENDFASSAVSQKISFDQALGSKEGVDSTPSFFLNGERLPDEASAGILQGDLTAIEALLDEKLEQQ
tara:strand:- start:417 stop:1112 length:696 start_codon:yes stop_codon:yes gene_type:complete